MQQPVVPATVSPISYLHETSIGRILLDMGKIKPEDAERILRYQKEKGLLFGEAAQSLGLINQADIQQVLAKQFSYPYLQPGQGNYSPELVAAYEPFSKQVETFRALRSQLMLRWFARGRKSLVVAGINPNDGASYVVANLAVVFSQLGETTLLVDANMRSPRQHKIFNLLRNTGLSDLLASRAETNIISKIPAFENLSVLNAGTLPPNPQELLNRPPLAALAANVGSEFEVTLFDAPALSTAADALSVAAVTGGILLVVRKHVTRLTELNSTREKLAISGVEIVGTILMED